MGKLVVTGSWSDNANSRRYYANNSCIDYYVNDDNSVITEEAIEDLLERKYSMFPVLCASPKLSKDKKELEIHWERSFLD